jgi:hypothetical protein
MACDKRSNSAGRQQAQEQEHQTVIHHQLFLLHNDHGFDRIAKNVKA